MGFVARGRVIIHKYDDHQDNEDDDMEAHMVEPVRAVTPYDFGPSQMPSSSTLFMEEYFANLSKILEDMSLAQQVHFDQIFEWQQTHEEYVFDQLTTLTPVLGTLKIISIFILQKNHPVQNFRL
ncbi:hypothetical protein LR48_Vigan11g054900 [Vigna angularis]|uniref:Uncharacterized protein n=1 Tax=Phaseolus angularis TaxID=3914 RepID=A0A0L9VR31_PHAAN|nr:hypothetical protein LR48_Vigan11g054900 [Vigna angularis]